ncbi:MAG: DinB family protein [Deinococcota bacterium]
MSLITRNWQHHNHVTNVLLTHLQTLPTDVLTLQASWGGMSIRDHLEHLIYDVLHWLSHVEPIAGSDPAEDIAGLQKQLEDAHTCLFAAVNRAPTDAPTLPHMTNEQLLMHMLIHESHHRAQVLDILKTHNLPLPYAEAYWGLWRS